jgi:hypothetical protein
MVRFISAVLLSVLLLGCASGKSTLIRRLWGQDNLVVGSIEEDPPTYHCLGFSLPILSGDDNYNASVSVSYRKTGTTEWRQGLPLMRVRPETVPFDFTVSEQFAGSLFDLDPGSDYDIKFSVRDPDGVNVSEIETASRTRSLPQSHPENARVIHVATIAAWQEALDVAAPGDIITVADGTYTGSLHVTQSGTPENPVFIRGRSRNRVVLEADGADEAIRIHSGPGGPAVKNVTIEDITVRGAVLGIRVLGSENIVICNLIIEDVSSGINATSYVEEQDASYENTNLTVMDNLLQGREADRKNFDQSLWNFEGIVLEGSGHVVAYNTLSGFGDSLGIEICYGGLEPDYCPLYPPPHRDTVRNRAIDFYNNDILWGGDDGIELDFAERNVRAYRNRIAHTHMGISFQPVWGGPVYAFRNIIFNPAARTYKLNNEPTGFYILHNTSIRNDLAWWQPSPEQEINNMKCYNNLFVGTSGALEIETWLVMDEKTNNVVEMDYNGWFPDGDFTFLLWNFKEPVFDSLQDLRTHTPFEQHGVALRKPIFENLGLPSDSLSALPPGPSLDITPHVDSGAVDAGRMLPNISDGFTGAGPDLGARERGTPHQTYGARFRSRQPE